MLNQIRINQIICQVSFVCLILLPPLIISMGVI